MPFVFDEKFAAAVFGAGDIGISASRTEDTSPPLYALLLLPVEPAPIGSDLPELDGKRTSEVFTPIRLFFEAVDSLDVFIAQCEVLRKWMAEGRGPDPEIKAT